MDEVVLYKIRDKNTGLFSRGGQDVILPYDKSNFRARYCWNKMGKLWTYQGIKLHLAQFDTIPENWEVVEYVAKCGRSGSAAEFKKTGRLPAPKRGVMICH